jgi:hypothetical protein
MVPRSFPAGALRRRDLLRHGAGALALATLAPVARPLAALAAPAPVGPERIYAALVDAVADAPTLRLGPAAVAGATARFAARYATLAPPERASVDAALGAVERATNRPFSAMARADRLRFVAGAAHQRPDLAERALALVALGLHDDDDDGMARVPVTV